MLREILSCQTSSTTLYVYCSRAAMVELNWRDQLKASIPVATNFMSLLQGSMDKVKDTRRHTDIGTGASLEVIAVARLFAAGGVVGKQCFSEERSLRKVLVLSGGGSLNAVAAFLSVTGGATVVDIKWDDSARILEVGPHGVINEHQSESISGLRKILSEDSASTPLLTVLDLNHLQVFF